MIGYVQFAILVNVEKSHYRDVYERMYTEFQENILYRPSIIDPNDLLIFVLFGENVFMVDWFWLKLIPLKGLRMQMYTYLANYNTTTIG